MAPGVILAIPVEVANFGLHNCTNAVNPASGDALLLAKGFECGVDLLAALQADQGKYLQSAMNCMLFSVWLIFKIIEINYSINCFAVLTMVSTSGKYTCSREAA